MSERRIGIIMHGVTGRMGLNQHLMRSILEIRKQGGVALKDGTRLTPDPLLVGRNAAKIEELARKHGVQRWTTDLDAALASSEDEVFFDAASTQLRPRLLKRAIKAGKHVYCEKPVSTTLAEAMDLYRAAKKARVKHGVVQDKLWLPGLLKLAKLRGQGFFGKILSVRGEFGYWVFEGDPQSGRPPRSGRRGTTASRTAAASSSTCCATGATCSTTSSARCSPSPASAPRTSPSAGTRAAGSTRRRPTTRPMPPSSSKGGVIAHFNSSWTVRVRRDDLLTLQVDGTEGSAVAGLRKCFVQSYADTPKPVWNPDIPQPIDFFAGWKEVPDEGTDNAFKVQWEVFLRHVAGEGPFRWGLLEGAKGVQLAELGLKSWQQKKWIDIPKLRP